MRIPLRCLLQCLVYACRIQPRLTPADVASLVDLLHHLMLRTRGYPFTLLGDPVPSYYNTEDYTAASIACTALYRAALWLLYGWGHICVHAEGRGAGDMASWQQAGIVLVALVSALLPKDIPGALDDEADDQLLGDLCM